jgi:2-polyprenyl-3-methyl-5-hydroxy-6-metoxy-1,4-benzoquinol methylase
MNEDKNKQLIKSLIPPTVRHYLYSKIVRNKNQTEFANYILNSAIEYSKNINGDAGSFDRRLKHLILNSYNDCPVLIQDVLTAFMPNYEKNLYQFYKNQEYLIFYRFLCYPFRSDMSCYFSPYEKALARFQSNDILDYGAGIPYGLIYSLLNNRKSINSITLIDLDLIHLDFVQFLINKIAPDIKLDIYRLKDTESFPKMEGKYNFFFGKDIFEHLRNPLNNLKELITYSKPDTICYFDFQNKGKKENQHLSPNIDFLTDEMIKMGFKRGTMSYGLSEFIRIM